MTDHSDGLDQLVGRRHREVCLAFAISALATFGLQMFVFGYLFPGVDWIGAYILLTGAAFAVARPLRESQVILGRTVHVESGIPVMLGMVLATVATPFALMGYGAG